MVDLRRRRQGTTAARPACLATSRVDLEVESSSAIALALELARAGEAGEQPVKRQRHGYHQTTMKSIKMGNAKI